MRTSCGLVASQNAKQCDTKASSWPLATGQCESCILFIFYLFQHFIKEFFNFDNWFNTFVPPPKKLECISFIHMTVESKLFFFLLLGILKINPIHRCWHDICSFGIQKINLKTHDDKSLFFKDLLGTSFLLNNHISTS